MELNPNFAYPHLILGFALEVSGNLTKAITEYEKVYVSEKGGELMERTFGAAMLAHGYGRQCHPDTSTTSDAVSSLAHVIHLDETNARAAIRPGQDGGESARRKRSINP